MKLINTKIPRNHNFITPPQWWREVNALKATTINADKYRIISTHWSGPLTIGGKLACNDDSPLATRFKTVPIIQLRAPG